MEAVLRNEDLVTLLALVGAGEDRVVARSRLGLSASEFDASLARCAAAELYAPRGGKVRRQDLLDFLVSGIGHVFPGRYGDVAVTGIPTSYSTPPLRNAFVVGPDAEIVWSHPRGWVRGIPLEPLTESLPGIAADWPEFHALAALADALRAGRSRERHAAADGLRLALAA